MQNCKARGANFVGEKHPLSKLTDHEVALLRQLRELQGYSYGKLAKIFEVSKSCVKGICDYHRR